MKDRDDLKIDVSGAWVREVSPMLATSRVFSQEHLGSLFYPIDSKASGDSGEKQITTSLRQGG